MKSNGKKARRIEGIIWLAVTLIITGWSVMMYMDGKGTKTFMGILTIGALLAVGLWQKKARSPFPPLFGITTYLFIFVSVGLGTFGGAYSIKHFDDFLHIFSGVWIGYGAYLLMFYMVGDEKAKGLPKAFVALYIILSALAVAGLWELLEFAGDKLFHFTAQGRDPDDTMFDMIDGLAGGIATALFLVRNHGKGK